MTDLRKAAEMALEALNEVTGWQWGGPMRVMDEVEDAIQALRQALAQEQEPDPCPGCRKGGVCRTPSCGRLKLPVNHPYRTAPVDAVNMTQEREHEPVAWMWKDGSLTSDPDEADGTWTKLYIAPPKREWVGLTDDDVHDAFNYVEMVKLLDFDRDRPEWCEAFANACEARLRHRNGEKQ